MFRAFLLIAALASGGASAWLVSGMNPGPVDAQAATVDAPAMLEEVLVASGDIDRGAIVRAEDLRWHAWPADAISPAFVLRSSRPDAPNELAGSVLRSQAAADMPVAASEFAPAGSSLLSAVLTPGKRAVAISISAEQSAGGFVLPDDRVDVVVTSCRDRRCGDGATARTILRNIRVLAIDQSGAESDKEATLIGKTATLELTSAQAETLVGAEASGMLSLVLRSAADHAELVEQPEPGRGAAPQVIRVWRGGVSAQVTVQ